MLHALESGSPRVFVENLNILAQRYFYMPGQGKAQSGGLDVSFDLYGYIAPRAPGRTARAAGAVPQPQAQPEPQPEDAPQPMSGGQDATE